MEMIYFLQETLSITWIKRQDLFLVISIYERQMLDISFSLESFSKFFLLRCSVNHPLLCTDIYIIYIVDRRKLENFSKLCSTFDLVCSLIRCRREV